MKLLFCLSVLIKREAMLVLTLILILTHGDSLLSLRIYVKYTLTMIYSFYLRIFPKIPSVPTKTVIMPINLEN